MASNYDYSDFVSSTERNSKVGTIESMLSGIVSGLIAIPKGFFSLGASLMDLGVNSGKAAAVEKWFDDLTEFDEKAEATAALVAKGYHVNPNLTRNVDILVNESGIESAKTKKARESGIMLVTDLSEFLGD